VTAAVEAHRVARSLEWVKSLSRDIGHAMRLLRRQPLLTAAVVATLAVGIAAPTSIFSLMNGAVFRPQASNDPAAFFRVAQGDGGHRGAATSAQYLELRQHAPFARELVAWSWARLDAELGPQEPSQAPGLLVSCNFFRVFSTGRPRLGRLLAESDCTSARPVAVMSERMWQHRFGGEPSVVGRSFTYGNVPITVVGVIDVLPLRNQMDDPDYLPDLWLPYTTQPAMRQTSEFLDHDYFGPTPSGHTWLEVAGLLRPGFSRTAAAAELQLVQTRVTPAHETSDSRLVLTDRSRWETKRLDVLGYLAMILVLPALILLMACVNVTALLLARAIARRHEVAVRLALGTSRAGLIRRSRRSARVSRSRCTDGRPRTGRRRSARAGCSSACRSPPTWSRSCLRSRSPGRRPALSRRISGPRT
jgi:hypothetical protein